jgi:hypothetical protein
MIVIPHWLDCTLVAAVYAFALGKGGAPERWLAGTYGSVWLFNTLFRPMIYGQHLAYLLTLDVVLALVTVLLAIRYDRWWLLVAGAASLLRIATDGIAILIPLQPWTLGTALITWGYIRLAALATGTWSNWRTRAAAAPLARA